jgi:hypothetical protein
VAVVTLRTGHASTPPQPKTQPPSGYHTLRQACAGCHAVHHRSQQQPAAAAAAAAAAPPPPPPPPPPPADGHLFHKNKKSRCDLFSGKIPSWPLQVAFPHSISRIIQPLPPIQLRALISQSIPLRSKNSTADCPANEIRVAATQSLSAIIERALEAFKTNDTVVVRGLGGAISGAVQVHFPFGCFFVTFLLFRPARYCIATLHDLLSFAIYLLLFIFCYLSFAICLLLFIFCYLSFAIYLLLIVSLVR